MVVVILVGLAFNTIIGYGPVGVVIAVVIAAGLAIGSYWKSDEIALRMSGAQPASVEEYPRLHNIVEGLCIAAGLPKPRLYVIQDDAPNAFATGRDPKHAAIAATTGLLDKMNRIELEAVLAHELSHVKNYDILVSTLAVTMVGAVALLSDIGIRSLWFGGGRRSRDDNSGGGIVMILALVFLVLAPIVAKIMQLAVSRRRETLGRLLRRGDHPVPARHGVRPGEAARRPDGGPLGVARHRPPLDRAADGPDEGRGPVLEAEPPLRHPSTARGAHRRAA